MSKAQAYTAVSAGSDLVSQELDLGVLGDEQVEVQVEHCGLCHSDLSLIDNDWGFSRYPMVAGHEAVGRVVAMGRSVKGLQEGDYVGVGWLAGSCETCNPCRAGDFNLCRSSQPTFIGRPGGFAERLRCHWRWALRLPDALKRSTAGPLFCAGATVFGPLLEFDVRPTMRVGVVGIGGLGHLALAFLRAWGCEVIALTSAPAKAAEAQRLGAHRAVSSIDPEALASLAGQLDFLLITVNAPLDWKALLGTLGPRGRMHLVGVVSEPLAIPVLQLMSSQRSVSASPIARPSVIAQMLEFCARHQIEPQVERFPMAQINQALQHLREGKARYRVVLDR